MWETGIKLWMRGPGSLESSRGNMCDREGGRWRLHGHGDGWVESAGCEYYSVAAWGALSVRVGR